MRWVFIFLSALAVVQAQTISSPVGPSSLRVHGEATVSAEPDQAELDIGIVVQASTPKAATDRNAAQTSVVIQQLRTIVPSADIKTINFSVDPNYRYPKEGGPPTIAGYSANDTVRLVLNDISLLQRVIEIATKSGATSINRLTFTLHDESAVRARALANAASQAQSGADALAASLKLKLGRLLRVEEGQPVIVSPPREISFGKAQSTDLTPISPGTINVHADVDLTYEISSGYTSQRSRR